MISLGIDNSPAELLKGKDRVALFVQNIIEHFDLDQYEADIDIRFVRKCDQDAGGYCYGDNEEVEIEVATHVQGEKLDLDTVMTNLGHEMVHAKQLITGQLVDHGLQLVQAGDCQTLVNVSEWEGETVSNLPYDQQPWEIEAYNLEHDLFITCFEE